MADKKDLKVVGGVELRKTTKLADLLKESDIKNRFEEILGKNAPAFMSSIITAVSQNDQLKVCEPMSVISAAAIAATLGLPIVPGLGIAHIVPYGGKAQFQIGWKGFVQLALRTGQYSNIHAAPVYDGQLKFWHPITDEIEFDHDGKKSDKVIGYYAKIKMKTGFEKHLYMTVEEVTKHGKRYSQTFKKGFGNWVDNFEAMSLKTVIKLLLSKYGELSSERIQTAIQADQSVITPDGKFEYIDAPDQTPETTNGGTVKSSKEVLDALDSGALDRND